MNQQQKEKLNKTENKTDYLTLIFTWVKQNEMSKREFLNELKPILDSEENGRHWFDNYQDVDNYLFSLTDNFVTEYKTPTENTINTIKKLIKNN